ncbi:HlyD family secretion protein [Candidatus Methylobacter oryzae]|uniref:HlyD family secretion protein n=1 Tax=Candidatus Methylobacter oryzae TaxID=2497749 RepID=A0ABY3CAZ6_9GAMM|nr:HlyD family secretion protein [Candidatus Methylobacter oryzae]TRW92084.1 HlyD family secretion protein [Candidatus Methylobacter oryzae]
MPRFSPILLILLIGIPLLSAIGYWLLERQHYETTDNAYLRSNIVLISPKVEGYVTKIAISDNQAVKQNDVLVTIDDRDYQAKVIQAQADVNEELAHIERLRAMKTSQRAHIETAGANIAAVQARREQIQKDLQRFNNLIDRGSAARQALDKIQAESKQAQAELRGSQASASAEHNQLAALDSEITETEARLQNAQAALELAKIDLEHTQIKAPVDGIIGNRGVQLGQLVQPGVALASLVQDSKIWVVANFKETQLEHMRPGQQVTIEVDAYPELKLTGTVDSFSPASGSEFSLLPEENATGNFTKIVRRVPVKIVFDTGADTKLLKPGLSVTARVHVQ